MSFKKHIAIYIKSLVMKYILAFVEINVLIENTFKYKIVEFHLKNSLLFPSQQALNHDREF